MKNDLGNFVLDTINSMNAVRKMELNAVPPVTRGSKQRDIERSIVQFSPDLIEASEIIDAVMASLDRRYEGSLEDAEECRRWMKEALEKADRKLNER